MFKKKVKMHISVENKNTIKTSKLDGNFEKKDITEIIDELFSDEYTAEDFVGQTLKFRFEKVTKKETRTGRVWYSLVFRSIDYDFRVFQNVFLPKCNDTDVAREMVFHRLNSALINLSGRLGFESDNSFSIEWDKLDKDMSLKLVRTHCGSIELLL